MPGILTEADTVISVRLGVPDAVLVPVPLATPDADTAEMLVAEVAIT